MSELTPCNRCTFGRLLARAAREGKVVHLVRAPFSTFTKGLAVYVLPPDVEPPTPEQAERDVGGDAPNRVAWMAELTDRCAC